MAGHSEALASTKRRISNLGMLSSRSKIVAVFDSGINYSEKARMRSHYLGGSAIRQLSEPDTCNDRFSSSYKAELVYLLEEWESRLEITVALISPAFSAVPLQIT